VRHVSVTLISDEGAQAMLTRIREAPECRRALATLSGEVLEIRITGYRTYRLAFRNGGVELDPTSTPTIAAEASIEVADAIMEGRLDPLVAMLTRRLKAKIDPIRGPLLRTILRAGTAARPTDMGWERVIGRAPRG
jgi:hypothetical protein